MDQKFHMKVVGMNDNFLRK